MTILKVGVEAKLKQPVISGKVLDARYNHEKSQMEYALAYTGADDEPHQRWFLESGLEPV